MLSSLQYGTNAVTDNDQPCVYLLCLGPGEHSAALQFGCALPLYGTIPWLVSAGKPVHQLHHQPGVI